ncbi:MAG TPA: hypothetical protein VJT78_04645 [Candidatus Dormibacteraeota bacterium]|nr:hypothetical protein [Candidatus Dormibacteraeota bacterium]
MDADRPNGWNSASSNVPTWFARTVLNFAQHAGRRTKHKARRRRPLYLKMRFGLAAFATLCVTFAVACSTPSVRQASFGQPDSSEFRQPLPEPPLHQATHAPSPSQLLSQIADSIQTSQFEIVGTEMTPRAQGQFGAQVYHLSGALTIEGPALELQPWNEFSNSGPEPDIDARGDFVMVDSAIYTRTNTFSEWQMATVADPYWGLFADVNPALWQGSSSGRVQGETSIGGSTAWVLELTNRFGRQFKAWIREKDGYPLRYTASWKNAKGSTYYINALYGRFNLALEITKPDMLNRGVANPGAPLALPSGSVTITDVEYDCSGTSSRRPAPHDKFVLVTLAFVATGPGPIPISPDVWRLYGDGVNGAAPVDSGAPGLLRIQTLSPGNRVAGVIAFEVPEVAYQLIAVGHLVGTTAVMSAGLPMLPNGTLPCS